MQEQSSARAPRVFTAVAGLLSLVMLMFGGQLLVSGWFSSTDGGIHRFHEIAWGIIEGILMLSALAVQILRSHRKVGAIQQALVGAFALLAVMVTARTFDPFTTVFILLVGVLLFLHPARADVFRAARPLDRKLMTLSLAAAIPLWAYAINEISQHVNAPAGDPHAELAHYAGTATAAIAIPLVGLVASFRAPGSGLSLWSAGVAAVTLGTAGIVFPNHSSSFGTLWGAAAALWGVTFAAVGKFAAEPHQSLKRLSSSEKSLATTAVTCLTVIALIAGVEVAAAGSRPDLVVVGPAAGSSAAAAGGAISVSAKIKNAGSASAGATKTAFYLSKDGTKNAGDVLLGKKATTSIPRGATKSVRLSDSVPGSTKPGFYKVLACADATTQVRESNESNNCKASANNYEIVAAYDSTPFGPTDPTSVDPVLDEGSSVTTLVTAADGGRVSLVSPNGATYTLDVPAGALTSDQDITMTALSSVTNDPFGGGFVAGVELQPAGLEFEKEALLTIHPATPITAAQETPFSADDNGNAFHLYPLKIKPIDPTFGIWHFTLYGLFTASELQRDAQGTHVPVDPAAALSQEIQRTLALAREKNLTGTSDTENPSGLSDEELDLLERLMNEYYDTVVRPLLIDVSNTEECARLADKMKAVRAALTWIKQSQLWFGEPLVGEIAHRADDASPFIEKILATRCIFPDSWIGKVNGTLRKDGLTERWGGKVTWTKDYSEENIASYTVTSGSLQWGISGTDDDGCTYSGSGTLEASGGGVLTKDDGFPSRYSFRVNRATFSVPVTKSCPPPVGSQQVGFSPLNADFGSTTDAYSSRLTTPWHPGTWLIVGGRTYHPPDFPNATSNWTWSLTPN